MVFTSWLFGFFLAGTVVVYWILPNIIRSYFLLAASILFAAYAVPLHTFLLLGLSTFVYICGAFLKGRKALLVFSLSVPIGVLGYFKYGGLLEDLTRKTAVLFPGLTALEFAKYAVPLGISFFTFKLVHYLADSYWGIRPEGSYWQFLLYVFFFPILPSGPIERWPNFLEQTRQSKSLRIAFFTEGCQKIITGLFKKIVLADTLAVYSEKLNIAGHSSLVYWIAAYAYALRIYFDFSGYSDIAIGSARLFGYRIIENFDYPYLRRNISLFWKSWHMSLTGWFRDYVFIPLGGSRVSLSRIVLNTFIVMALTGLWHGAALHFIAWGLYHGAGLILLRLYSRYLSGRLPDKFRDSRLCAILSTALTFNFVVVGWVFFAADFGQSIHVIEKMFFIR